MRIIKYHLTILVFFLSLSLQGKAFVLSADEPVFTPRVAVKLNSLLCVGVANPALEVRLNDRMSFQMEGIGIFYLRFGFMGSDATKDKIVLGASWMEGRYYVNKVFKGFYLGPNFGWSVFRLNKGIFPFYSKQENTFQTGYNFMAGISLGYVWEFSKHWAMDFSWGGGYQGARYEAYVEPSGERILDTNGSGEWMPIYKGGASLVYKF